MKPYGSLPRQQEPAAGPYPEPDESIHLFFVCIDVKVGLSPCGKNKD
jgi:hypothetical protein